MIFFKNRLYTDYKYSNKIHQYTIIYTSFYNIYLLKTSGLNQNIRIKHLTCSRIAYNAFITILLHEKHS